MQVMAEHEAADPQVVGLVGEGGVRADQGQRQHRLEQADRGQRVGQQPSMASGRSGAPASSRSGPNSFDRPGGSSVAARPGPAGARWLSAHRSAPAPAAVPPTVTD